MFLCYIDESGTIEVPGNTSHFILAGISIPIEKWKDCDKEISAIKAKYSLVDAEIHTALMLRKYLEQSKVNNFKNLHTKQRIFEVERLRNIELLRLQKIGNSKLYHLTKKNYRKTKPYLHLTLDERKVIIKELCLCISNWGFARLFAECVDKFYFDPARVGHSIARNSFEQVVARFEAYLQIMCKTGTGPCLGLLIHDNNQTVAMKHTRLMKEFHETGTLWNNITQIIETPFFVDSELTSMVQIADLCSYALRKYVEDNNENELFDLVFQRADRKDGIVVGVRHFTDKGCKCKICLAHRKKSHKNIVF
jgi:hypothetical protein